MKRSIFVLISLFGFFQVFANNNPKEVSSTITEVSIFINGAQVSREASASIPEGNSTIKFVGISQNINPNSLQVKAKGEFTVLSVVHQLNYFEKPIKTEEIEKLNLEKQKLQYQIEDENTLLQVLNEEESLILHNKSLSGQETGVQIDQLRATAEFYRTRIKEIRIDKLNISRKIKGIQEKLNQVNQQLGQLNFREGTNTTEVVVAISSPKATSGKFLISYLVNNAGWTPHYDLRVKDVSSPIQLAYKANVYQNTGESWKDVLLTLSTGNPAQSGTKPTLNPWRLDFYQPVPPPGYGREMPQAYNGAEAESLKDVDSDYATSYDVPVQQIENATTVSFKIDTPYDVPSDGKQYVINMKDYELPAYYEYYCAPKLDTDVFLTAQITGWETLNLLNGEANLFFEETYLGKSYLDVQSVADTLDLSLGRDQNIVVLRTVQKEDNRKKFLSNKQIDSRGWDIEIRNKKKMPINIVIEDHIPIPVTTEIEVEKEFKDAEYDEKTGKLSWKFALPSNTTKKLNFKYTVKYPKKNTVILE